MKRYFTPQQIIYGCCIVLLSSCASYHLRQGNRLFNDMAYNSAISEYEKALSKKPFPAGEIGVAESYRLVNNTAKAEEAYSKVMELKEVQPIHKLRYAQLLMRNGKYPAAKMCLENYLKDMPNDNTAKDLLASCDKIDDLKKDSSKYTVESVKINTGQSNFCPTAYKDGIVFVSDRSGGEKYEWTGQSFLDLYYSKIDQNGDWSIPQPLKGDVNGKYHDGPAAFGNDTTMYFTRDNYLKKKIGKSEDEVVNLKIYQSTKHDTVWSHLKELPFNSSEYSTGHPTLSRDGNTMYFVSDMPGGLGGTDIWMTKKDSGGWGKPINLGPKINTPFDEMFPTMYHDSLLYFSSQGHTNMGGLDIFYAKKDGDNWGDAVNMGYPINSSHDDFGLLMNDEGKGGFFSSDRASTTQDIIYSFKVKVLRFTVDGTVVEKSTQQPLSGVTVELLNKKTGQKADTLTGDDGHFKFILEPETEYTVVGSKDNFYSNKETVSTVGKTESEDMTIKLKMELERIIINKPIVLENIYYDLDKWYIRKDAEAGLDKLVTIMMDNPSIRIELSSHTDSRAADHYNMVLSQKRAQSAVDYIVSKGISKDRIVAKGYGETQLVNRCKNGVKCSEEEHQQNRRTEFKVISIDKKTNL